MRAFLCVFSSFSSPLPPSTPRRLRLALPSATGVSFAPPLCFHSSVLSTTRFTLNQRSLTGLDVGKFVVVVVALHLSGFAPFAPTPHSLASIFAFATSRARPWRRACWFSVPSLTLGASLSPRLAWHTPSSPLLAAVGDGPRRHSSRQRPASSMRPPTTRTPAPLCFAVVTRLLGCRVVASNCTPAHATQRALALGVYNPLRLWYVALCWRRTLRLLHLSSSLQSFRALPNTSVSCAHWCLPFTLSIGLARGLSPATARTALPPLPEACARGPCRRLAQTCAVCLFFASTRLLSSHHVKTCLGLFSPRPLACVQCVRVCFDYCTAYYFGADPLVAATSGGLHTLVHSIRTCSFACFQPRPPHPHLPLAILSCRTVPCRAVVAGLPRFRSPTCVLRWHATHLPWFPNCSLLYLLLRPSLVSLLSIFLLNLLDVLLMLLGVMVIWL